MTDNNEVLPNKKQLESIHCLVEKETLDRIVKYLNDRELDNKSQAVRILLKKGLDKEGY